MKIQGKFVNINRIILHVNAKFVKRVKILSFCHKRKSCDHDELINIFLFYMIFKHSLINFKYINLWWLLKISLIKYSCP